IFSSLAHYRLQKDRKQVLIAQRVLRGAPIQACSTATARGPWKLASRRGLGITWLNEKHLLTIEASMASKFCNESSPRHLAAPPTMAPMLPQARCPLKTAGSCMSGIPLIGLGRGS
ncbi:hypothetical protein, partial [Chromobacterium sp.]|uniref:hypothetical protein n=1 Tax=Chromobacterium sp. TaxID=306190 RepID=UPI0035B21CD4